MMGPIDARVPIRELLHHTPSAQAHVHMESDKGKEKTCNPMNQKLSVILEYFVINTYHSVGVLLNFLAYNY